MDASESNMQTPAAKSLCEWWSGNGSALAEVSGTLDRIVQAANTLTHLITLNYDSDAG